MDGEAGGGRFSVERMGGYSNVSRIDETVVTYNRSGDDLEWRERQIGR